jgi:hypothetical protein
MDSDICVFTEYHMYVMIEWEHNLILTVSYSSTLNMF